MSFRTAVLALPIALMLAASFASAGPEPTVEQLNPTFFDALQKSLVSSKEQKKGLVFYVGGQTIAGVVKEITLDAVVVANQEFDRIVIRRDQIAAVAGY
jgi:hypothetical protein